MSNLKARQERMVKPVGLVRLSSAEFTRLYNEHQSLVRAIAYQMAGANDLDEIVQQAFIKIWNGYGEFRHDSKITSWIYRISTNVALDFLRARARRLEFADAQRREGVAGGLDRATPEGKTANRDLVQKGLASMSEDHRTVLILAFLHELPLAEVAEVLEISEGTVKSRLHYAKAAFRDYLAKNGVEL